VSGRAAFRPDDLALACGDRTLTWARLAAEVDGLAGWLASVAAPGERVAFVADNTAEWVVAYYAVPKAGLRLGFVNQRLGAPGLRAAVARFAPAVLMADAPALAALGPGGGLTAGRAPVVVPLGGSGGTSEQVTHQRRQNPGPPRSPHPESGSGGSSEQGTRRSQVVSATSWEEGARDGSCG